MQFNKSEVKGRRSHKYSNPSPFLTITDPSLRKEEILYCVANDSFRAPVLSTQVINILFFPSLVRFLNINVLSLKLKDKEKHNDGEVELDESFLSLPFYLLAKSFYLCRLRTKRCSVLPRSSYIKTKRGC